MSARQINSARSAKVRAIREAAQQGRDLVTAKALGATTSIPCSLRQEERRVVTRPLRIPGRTPEEDAAKRQIILDYVEDNPGITAQEVISTGRGGMSRKRAEEIIKDLLYHDPKMLRSEHPEGTHAFGRGAAKLYRL